MNIKFSVLMSLYNKETPSNLNDCLASLYAQTVMADEIVIIYDGYISDELDSVVKAWSTKLPIRVSKLVNNVGLGDALNRGLPLCQHEIVARMDTDDICLPDRFEKQLIEFSADPDLIILGGSIFEFDEIMRLQIGKRILPVKHDDIVAFSKIRSPFNHMTVMFKKSKILSVGGYQRHLFMEDYNLWLRCIHAGFKVRNIPDVIVNVRTGLSMVQRRRGVKYIKSEVNLFLLKNRLGTQGIIFNSFVFLLRTLPRVVPASFLSIYYKLR
ncbi:glycosyltransferase [Edwardsiella tarda]